MARKKSKVDIIPEAVAEPVDMGITKVLEVNYMPYAMTCIVGRAIPDIDGFKPAHRKLLYTMFKMGLLSGETTKSTKVVGQTMMYNPHGDASIYDTLAAMTTGKETQLLPFIKSKGSFGKHYSTTATAASRYTECKLAPIAAEIFGGIDEDAVDFVPNFDNSSTEPTLLPTAFPNILAYCNIGIAVGMNCNICSFNLRELCAATEAYLKNDAISVDDIMDLMPAPDFSTGGGIIYNVDTMRKIYSTGVGSIPIRAKYIYDEKGNRIVFTEIPYDQKIENIRTSIISAVNEGKITGISDVRDEMDITGLKLAVDLKKGADKDKILAQLYKRTGLEARFSCNFNILTEGMPKVMGIKEILQRWVRFRVDSLRRVYNYRLARKSEKLHLLEGLQQILLDIDEAIRIIRATENDNDVVPNLMEGFRIDELQAEYVANIRLRHLNRDFIVKRLEDIEQLEKDIAELKELIASDAKIKKAIIKQLKEISDKYGIDRKTDIIFEDDAVLPEIAEEVDDTEHTCFFSREGYFKKCTLASLRGNAVHSLKESDEIIYSVTIGNSAEVLFFTSAAQVYKSRVSSFDAKKASELGDYIPSKLSFDAGERAISAICLKEYTGNIVMFFANGKAVSVPANSYETKQNRKKLTKAFFAGSELVAVYHVTEPCEFFVKTTRGRGLLIKSSQITLKTTKTSSGSQIMTLNKGAEIESVTLYDPKERPLSKESRYRKNSLPTTGTVIPDSDDDSQQTLLD